MQALIQAPKGSDDQETAGDDLNVLNILSQLMPLFFPFSMMSEHQESVLKYIPANLRRYFTSLRFFLLSEKDGGFPILAYRWRSPAGKPPFVSGCQKIVKMKTSALIGSGKTSRYDSELPLTLFLNQIKKKRTTFCAPHFAVQLTCKKSTESD